MFEMSNNFATGGHWLRQLLQSDECVASVEESCINPGLAQKWAIISLFLILAGGLIGARHLFLRLLYFHCRTCLEPATA